MDGIRRSVAMMLVAGAARADFHVSPAGRDDAPGTSLAPFATLERARQAVRELKRAGGLPPGGLTVWLHGGVYRRTGEFRLGPEDAGTAAAPLSYSGLPGEEARLVGAERIEPAWFAPVTDASPVWHRIDAAARGRLLQVDLAARGIMDYGVLKRRGFYVSEAAALELFFKREPMPLARWPDPERYDPPQTFTNEQIRLFGLPVPEVTGLFLKSGMSDGVNAYRRDGLVAGKAYHLYRNTWEHEGRMHTAWFLTTQTGGYPSNRDPWWHRYNPQLGTMEPAGQSGARGVATFRDPAGIEAGGFAAVSRVVAPDAFAYGGDRPRRWREAEEPWLHGFWMHHWCDQHIRAAAIDVTNRVVKLAEKPAFGLALGQPYYAENLLEEITRPGEWYLNRRTGILYFWPPGPLAGADIWVSTLATPLWRLENTSNIVVRSLCFDMSRAELAVISGGASNRLADCTLRNAGGYACRVSGFSNGLERCQILSPGDGGVALRGGNRRDLVAAHNYVVDCDIRGFSRWSWTYQPGVLLEPESVGLRVAHNLIREAPHSAILFGRVNDCVIEFNRIHDVCRWSSDAGAIYVGRDWAARGNSVRFNLIHDVDSTFEGFGTHGIYLDDCQSGVEVFGNLLYRIGDAGVIVGGGRDNRIENNIMVACGTGLGADARGTGWMLKQGGSRKLWEDLQRYPYRGAVWSKAYPECAAIPASWEAVTNGLWLRPRGNVFARNVGFRNGRWISSSDSALGDFAEVADNLEDADPLFTDPGRLDLTLRADSPARALPGFVPIPGERIGPRKAEFSSGGAP